MIKELEASSFLDPLTNIYNRRKFFLECQLLGDSSYPQTLCLIDIDNFKQLNDSYGHDVGDRALVAFGLLQRAFRASDIFCRYGGEEFAVLLGNCSLDNAQDIMEQLRTRTHRLTLNLTDGRQCVSPPAAALRRSTRSPRCRRRSNRRTKRSIFAKERQGSGQRTHSGRVYLIRCLK